MNVHNLTEDLKRDAEVANGSQASPVEYQKPELRRLGRWNLFTRIGSPPDTVDNEVGSGFFEFNFGR